MNELFLAGELYDDNDYPLTLLKELLKAQINQLYTRTSISSYKSLAQIGLDDTATLTDIAQKIPVNTSLAIDVYTGTNQSLPLPEIATGYFQSGALIAIKASDANKCNFTFMNNVICAYCNYNKLVSEKVGKWNLLNSGEPIELFAGRVNYKLSNITMTGRYYFNSEQTVQLTDSPAENIGGIFVDVMIKGSDKIIKVTRNNPFPRKYIKQNDGIWSSIPLVGGAGTTDAQIRVGDFKIGSDGALYVRSSPSIVKAV